MGMNLPKLAKNIFFTARARGSWVSWPIDFPPPRSTTRDEQSEPLARTGKKGALKGQQKALPYKTLRPLRGSL
jgi:hypothetical protein